MEWNSREGIAKLLVAFEKELHRCASQDLLSLFCIYFLEIFMKFISILTETTIMIADGVGIVVKSCKTWSDGMG